jgi:hypothetical protein
MSTAGRWLALLTLVGCPYVFGSWRAVEDATARLDAAPGRGMDIEGPSLGLSL